MAGIAEQFLIDRINWTLMVCVPVGTMILYLTTTDLHVRYKITVPLEYFANQVLQKLLYIEWTDYVDNNSIYNT